LQPPPGISPFLYLPAFAWLFVPATTLPIGLSYALNGAFMAACAAAAALVCGTVYRVRAFPAVMLAFAWNPVTYSIAIGQTSNAGLLLAMLCTLGLTRGSVLLTALPAALLIYKPTYVLPLFAVMIVRRRLRAFVVAVTFGAILYLPSMWATGGDALWPIRWLRALRAWFPIDDAHTSAKAVSTTMLLVHAHAPTVVIGVFAALVIAAAIPLLARIDIAEAAALAMALAIVVSSHALTYEAVMLLPLLFVAVTQMREPWRTRFIVGVYLIAAVAPYADVIGFNTLALIAPALGLGWVAGGYVARARRVRTPAR
jgi:hypothetical protein